MNRKTFLHQLGLLATGTAVTPPVLLSNLKFSDRSGPFHLLRSNIGYFTGRGGTIGWFVTDHSIVVIDSQFPNSAADFISGIAEYGDGPSRFLFNTHHHGDHTAGNGVFLEQDYEIIAQKNVPELQQSVAEEQNNLDVQVYAETVFGDQYTMDVDHEQVTAKHYGPAHTGGDAAIWFREGNIAHLGDLVFNRWYPFIDRDGGASIMGWIETLEEIASEADQETLFIFGHANPEFGVTGNIPDVLYMRDYLSKLLDHVSKGIAEGKSREEITRLDQFDEFPNHQSAGERLSLPANLNVAYEELASELSNE